MKLRCASPILISLGMLSTLAAQPDLNLTVVGTAGAQSLAVPDFRGDASSQSFMHVFNDTLWSDLDDASVVRLIPKSLYPVTVPQMPSELLMRNWSAPPAQATYLAMGYSALQNGTFLFRGWLMDLRANSVVNSQVFEQRYPESADEPGARRAAHRFAADILEKLGGKSLFGTHIYFVRETSRAPNRRTEIWMMDADGGNQRQITHLSSNSTQPAISPDGSKLAFISYAHIFPAVFLYSTDSLRELPFHNLPEPPSVAAPAFTPDGRQVLYSVKMGKLCCQIVVANLDGTNPQALTASDSNNAEPKVNPKTGAQIAFVSGRAGHEQIYLMDMNGVGAERISPGTGEASNPSWHPNGQILAFAWTRGYGDNGWNIFTMDAARREPQQVTNNQGKNEHPAWAPDGLHLVFDSTRTGTSQIWSMWADGSHIRQLTTQGINATPAWGK